MLEIMIKAALCGIALGALTGFMQKKGDKDANSFSAAMDSLGELVGGAHMYTGRPGSTSTEVPAAKGDSATVGKTEV
jgi:hypothetical protein